MTLGNSIIAGALALLLALPVRAEEPASTATPTAAPERSPVEQSIVDAANCKKPKIGAPIAGVLLSVGGIYGGFLLTAVGGPSDDRDAGEKAITGAGAIIAIASVAGLIASSIIVHRRHQERKRVKRECPNSPPQQ